MSSRESRCAAAVYFVFVDILYASLSASTSKEVRFLFVGVVVRRAGRIKIRSGLQVTMMMFSSARIRWRGMVPSSNEQLCL